jgi:DeoR family transcriptional regulator, fructose operon transcriptional repressor
MSGSRNKKDQIASVVASIAATGETVILLAGTTIITVAGQLKDNEGIKVISNSLPVMAELQPCSGIEIIF